MPSGTSGLQPQPEPKKTVISKRPWDILSWHIWTIISVAGTAVLLFLNFTEYFIDTEVGANKKQTANILGALQLAIKAHELVIVASMVAITQQWILGDLMRDGTLFGLLGAETSLGQPTFIISKEYRTAIGYGISGMFGSGKLMPGERTSRRRVFLLVGFLGVGCVIASLAGPASGVLMIPRVDWFFNKEIFGIKPDIIDKWTWGRGEWPYLLVDKSMLFFVPGNPGMKYFYDLGRDQKMFISEENSVGWGGGETEIIHRFDDSFFGDVYMETSTTWGRKLDGVWTGGTNIRTPLRFNIQEIVIFLNLLPRHETGRWKSKYVLDVSTIDAWVACRRREKLPCGGTTNTTGDSDWCYEDLAGDGTLRKSQNLVLVRRTEADQFGGRGMIPNVYMTEGPLVNNTKYATSMEVLIELPDNVSPDVVICSISAERKSGIATFLNNGVEFYPASIDYLDYQLRSDDTKEPPSTLQYYEHWLDGVTTATTTQDFTFPARNASEPLEPIIALSEFGWVVSNYTRDFLDKTWADDAGELEFAVGGAFVYLLSSVNGDGWAEQGNQTQYQALTQNIPYLPKEAVLETPRISKIPTKLRIEAYREGYGFRLSTRTGLLGVVVLIAHAVIAVLASVWQLCWRRRVIKGWVTIPEYTALGIGSASREGLLENTCAGIEAKETLGSVVKVGETTPGHLEIAVVGPGLPGHQQTEFKSVGLEAYGFRGGC